MPDTPTCQDCGRRPELLRDYFAMELDTRCADCFRDALTQRVRAAWQRFTVAVLQHAAARWPVLHSRWCRRFGLRPVDFYVYLPSVEATAPAAVRLRAQGYLVDAHPSIDESRWEWLVVATVYLPASDDHPILAAQFRMVQLADRLGGLYGGWGAETLPDPGTTRAALLAALRRGGDGHDAQQGSGGAPR